MAQVYTLPWVTLGSVGMYDLRRTLTTSYNPENQTPLFFWKRPDRSSESDEV